jgi:F-type H+-transporting ATPase subunit b
MKRISALILALIMLVSLTALCSCNNKAVAPTETEAPTEDGAVTTLAGKTPKELYEYTKTALTAQNYTINVKMTEKVNFSDEAMENAKKLELEYTGLMENAKEESAEMVKSAAKKAQAHSDQIIADAKNEAAAIKVRAEEDIEREKKRAQNELRGEISELAVLVAEKVVEKEISEADHERFINDFIENVGDLK